MKHLFLLHDPPCGSDRSYNGVRLACALATNDAGDEVTVVLMADAVLCAKVGQKTPEGHQSLENMLRRVLSAGGQVLMCDTCLDARGLVAADMMEGAARSTMDQLARRTLEADKVVVV